jgi:predicted DNA-binding ribbon-helix-helix protein
MDRPQQIPSNLEAASKRPDPPAFRQAGSARAALDGRGKRPEYLPDGATVCQIRNVRVGARRTTLRLENAFWDAFDALCAREETTVDRILSDLEGRRRDEALTSMVRSYLIAYWHRRASGD